MQLKIEMSKKNNKEYIEEGSTVSSVDPSTMTLDIRYIDETVKRLEVNPNGNWIDVYAAETVELKKGQHKLISLGFALKLPDGYEAILAARSSTFKWWKILIANAFGIIDTTFCGNNDIWKLSVYPTKWSLPWKKNIIHKGDKIAQFRIVKSQPPIIFNEVDDLGGEDRGGFGTSGKK